MKKQILLLSSLGLFCFVQPNYADYNSKKTYIVYSHGFGEGEKHNSKERYTRLGDVSSMPIYPDAPGQLSKAVFYTKPAVHTLVNDLHEKAQKDDCESIRLVGYSCGAGTALNSLAKLAHYDENKEYFKDTTIRSRNDADMIMQKINNGAFVATAPFLHIRKAKSIASVGESLTAITIISAAMVGTDLCSKNKVDSRAVRFGLGAAGSFAAAYVVGDYLKKIYAQGLVTYILPYITGGKFDPHHETPLQSVEQLRGKLTCPILLHFHANDKNLENPDEDTIKVYDALKSDKTHIIITDDAWHNSSSLQFMNELEKFDKNYLKGERVDMSATQPSVEELRKKIYNR
ncbi:MAG TPA: hypothetical protein VHX42_00805 [Candidatus Babeliales bacterium]|jgi:hypothetical protein|nr:hypothetical protein [Candidatus Babeliales bacterium]